MTQLTLSNSVEYESPNDEASFGSGLWTENSVDGEAWTQIRRSAVLDGCKWDPQVGDIDTLSPFPLVLKASVWNRLARYAEQLTEEAISAENEISRRPELISHLGLPRSLTRVLGSAVP